jgi:hypothetical protein
LRLGLLATVLAVVSLDGTAIADSGVEIAARVVLELHGDLKNSDWIDVHVDGGGVPSIERCERLVEIELKRAYPSGTIKPKLTRPCRATGLPKAAPLALEPQLLRIREPLSAIDLFAISSQPTTGYVVRYSRMLSAVECERRRDKLVAEAHEAPKEQSKGALEEEVRRNQEQIRHACDKSEGHETEAHKPVLKRKRGAAQQDRWLEADTARSRCEQAKRMGEILAAKRAESPAAPDPVERSCVRE